MTPELTLLESDALMAGLNERVDQLEEENILLEQVIGRNSRMVEALLRNGRDGITLTGPDRRIVRVVKGLTGFDTDSLAGVLVESLAVPEDRQTIVDAYRQLLQGHCRKINIVVRVPLADGTIVMHTATLTDMLDD